MENKTAVLRFFPTSFKCDSLFESPRQGDNPFPKKEDGTLLYDDIDYKLTWAAMEELVGKGLVRSIGLSNFNSRQIDDILSVASIKPTVLQVQGVCDDEKVYFNWSNTVVACLKLGVLRAADERGTAVFWSGRSRATLTWPRWSCWPTVGTRAL